jgi:hypothetical protein
VDATLKNVAKGTRIEKSKDKTKSENDSVGGLDFCGSYSLEMIKVGDDDSR